MPAAAASVRYTLGFEAGFTGCKLSQTLEGDVAAAAYGSVYSAVPQMLQVPATAQTIQSVVHPIGVSTNSNPYLEGKADGGRLCAWLLANDSGKIAECPGTTPPAQSQPPLTAGASAACSPLGDGAYIYCAKSSKSKSATCDCENSFTLPAQATGKQSGPVQTSCGALLQAALKLPKFSNSQIVQIKMDVANAKVMLLRAKVHVDAWDHSAQAVSATYFGTGDTGNKEAISTIIDEELTMIGNISDVSKNFFTDIYPLNSTRPKNLQDAIAYVPAARYSEPNPIIFLLPEFFKEDNDYQAMTVVHELAHEGYAGAARDYVYDPIGCRALALIANVASLSPPSKHLPAINPQSMPLTNADSIAYFIHDLAEK
jgi:hypothetical protein